jgi:hypothetical protein
MVSVLACLLGSGLSTVASGGQIHSGAPQPEPAAVHIPEPMIFDLVRGLGARRGEFEVNVLTQVPLNDTRSRAVEWAPEIIAAASAPDRGPRGCVPSSRSSSPAIRAAKSRGEVIPPVSA